MGDRRRWARPAGVAARQHSPAERAHLRTGTETFSRTTSSRTSSSPTRTETSLPTSSPPTSSVAAGEVSPCAEASHPTRCPPTSFDPPSLPPPWSEAVLGTAAARPADAGEGANRRRRRSREAAASGGEAESGISGGCGWEGVGRPRGLCKATSAGPTQTLVRIEASSHVHKIEVCQFSLAYFWPRVFGGHEANWR